MIDRIDRCGFLIEDCGVAGERKVDGVFPGHANGILASRHRWLVIYATRGWRGIDDDRSIVLQIRADAPDGRLLRERMISACTEAWDPFGNGERIYKEHGHPGLFGVPRGAMVAGQPAKSGNVFVAKWRVWGKYPPQEGRIGGWGVDGPPGAKWGAVPGSQGVEWMQFRLNDAEDDIEILQPIRPLRQKGFESGPRWCAAEELKEMNQAFVQPVPFRADGTEWAEVNHFDQFTGGRLAPLKYRFDPAAGRYEWVEIGPRVRLENRALIEASLARVGTKWIVAARAWHPEQGTNPVHWTATEDLFGQIPPPVAGDVATSAPISAYACPDGVLRLFTGDASASPHGNGRDPLYVWDIDVGNGFRSSRRRVVFDSVAEKLPIRVESVPRVEMGKLLPHAGGRAQVFVHRVRTKSIHYPANTKAVINAAEKKCTGLYYEKIGYRDEYPGCWQFA